MFVNYKEQAIPEVMDTKRQYLNVNKTKNVKVTLSSDQVNEIENYIGHQLAILWNIGNFI